MQKVELKISKGVMTSVDPQELPKGAIADLLNGYILSFEDGVFVWKSNTHIPSIGEMTGSNLKDETIETYGYCPLVDGVFMAAKTNDGDTAMLKLVLSEDGDTVTINELYKGTDITLSKFIVAKSYYEGEAIETVYFLEKGQPQKSLNVRGDIIAQLPYISHARTYIYSNIIFKSYIQGSLPAGNYFYAYRSKSTDGRTSTNWSLVNGPVTPRNKIVPSDWTVHNLKPESFYALKNEDTTECGHRMYIEKIDPSYDKVEVAALYQSIDNEIKEAEIFFSGDIDIDSDGGMIIDHLVRGNGTIISVDDILEPGITVLSAKDFELTNKLNVLAGYEKNPELPETPTIKLNKWEEVSIDLSDGAASSKRIPLAGNFESRNSFQFSNEYFQPLPGMHDSSGNKSGFSIFQRAYEKNNGTPVYKEFLIEDDWANYKGGLFSSMFGYFRDQETYRISAIPVDNYGNRLGSRWLGDKKINASSELIQYQEYETTPIIGWASKDSNSSILSELRKVPVMIAPSDTKGKGYYKAIDEESLNVPPWLSLPTWLSENGDDFYDAAKQPFRVVGNLEFLEINNLDITDLVQEDENGNPIGCDIQGFHIAVANRDKLYEDDFIVSPVATQEKFTENDDNGNQLNFDLGIPITTKLNSKLYFNALACYSPFQDYDSLDYEGKQINIKRKIKNLFPSELTFEEVFSNLNRTDPLFYTGEFYHEVASPGSFFGSPISIEYEGMVGVRVAGLGSSNTVIFASKNINTDLNNYLVKEFKQLDRIDPSLSLSEQGIYLTELGIKINNGFGRISSRPIMTKANRTGNVFSFEAGAKGFLIVLDKDLNSWPYTTSDSVLENLAIANVKNNKTNFYQGSSDESLAKTEYRSTWHYQPITVDILEDIKTDEGKYIFNKIEVRGGDTKLGMFNFHRGVREELSYHAGLTNSWDTWNTKMPRIKSIDSGDYYAFDSLLMLAPLESERNIAFGLEDQGLTIGAKQHHLFYDNEIYNRTGDQTLFENNGTGYLKDFLHTDIPYLKWENQNYADYWLQSNDMGLSYFGLPALFNSVNTYPNGFIWSEFKYANEIYDSFKTFPTLNTMEVDGVFGSVNKIAGKNQRLYYWQDKAIGYIPIKERSYVQDQSGESIGVSTSESFSEFYTKVKGKGITNASDFSDIQVGFSWYDHNNEAWYFMDEGFQIIDIFRKTNNQDLKTRLLKDADLASDEEGRSLIIAYDPDSAIIYLSVKAAVNGIKTVGYNYLLNEIVYIGDDYIEDWFIHKEKLIAFPYTKKEANAFIRFTLNQDSEIYKVFDSINVLLKSGNIDKIRYHNKEFDITEEVNDEYYEVRKGALYGSTPLVEETDERIRGRYVHVDLIFYPDNASSIKSIEINLREDWS